MFVELQAVYLILSKYKADPSLSRKQIGTWSGWEKGLAENDRSLSAREVDRMREFLKRYAPTSYFKLLL